MVSKQSGVLTGTFGTSGTFSIDKIPLGIMRNQLMAPLKYLGTLFSEGYQAVFVKMHIEMYQLTRIARNSFNVSFFSQKLAQIILNNLDLVGEIVAVKVGNKSNFIFTQN